VPDTYATRLSDSGLLIAGSFGGSPGALLVAGDAGTKLDVLHFHSASTAAGNGRPTEVLYVAASEQDIGSGALALEGAGGTIELTVEALREIEVDPKAFARRALAPLDAPERERAMGFLAATIAATPNDERHELAGRLWSIREGLREHLPLSIVSRSGQRGVHIDRMLAVDERSFYLEGWLHVPDLARLTALAPEGASAELTGRLFRFPRPDVVEYFGLEPDEVKEEIGFICFFELDAPSVSTEGWLLEIEDDRGSAHELHINNVTTDVADVKQAILNDPHIHGLPDEELTANHVFPALSRIQSRLDTAVDVDTVVQFGTPPEAPDVTVIVPLYLQIQHLEVQLAAFADDPEIAGADLIYVLDSPQQKEELLTYAADLFPIYGLPFRVAVLEENAGFAGANNAGASLARGRLLLLLNSDILPASPGWLGKMRDFYDSTPDVGALCPKLLYEDDSIQHAGSYFHQLPGSDKWVDAHYFKGMHRSLPAANVPRAVPVVSGACMMVDRATYEELGGLSGVYVQGDYEDSDLCLQLWQRGRTNWYMPEAELYHLEGQSYSPDVRRPANRYNMWLHSHIWGEKIAELMQG
jgi:O-antigen biosynthesis protein